MSCKANEPDCFNCPYIDCQASCKDISRQNAYERRRLLEERNQEIRKAYEKCPDKNIIAKRFGLTDYMIYTIVKRKKACV